MWSDFSPRALTREQLAARISSLTWRDWKPIGITLHNTAAPTLAQWVESGPAHDARIKNLQSYYEGQGWKGGPHWFVSRNWINEFNNPLRRGTHSPSFNATHFGIEMVGDYDREEFNSGDGAKVRDNAVFLMAVLCRKFMWDPAKVIRLHKEDPKTTHECPGRKVNKADVVLRVQAELARLRGKPVAPKPTVYPGRQMGIRCTEFGGASEVQPSAYGGMVDGDSMGYALPAPTRQRNIRVYYGGKSVVAAHVDKGPWNYDDVYWVSGRRPAAEAQFQNKTPAQNGHVPTNSAGLDLTPAVFDYLMVPGKREYRTAIVDWEFTSDPVTQVESSPPPTPPPTPPPPVPEPPAPQPEPPEPPAPPPAHNATGFWSSIATALGAIGAFLYDWRTLAIIAVLLAVGIALFVDIKQVRATTTAWFKRQFGG